MEVSAPFLSGLGGTLLLHDLGREVLTAAPAGELPLTSYLTWIGGAVLANVVVGGVLIVALFDYAQVQQHGSAP